MHIESGNPQDAAATARPRIGRRALLSAGAVLAAGAGAATATAFGRNPGPAPAAAPPAPIPHHGARQSGLTYRQLPATRLLALDLPASADREALRGLLAGLDKVLAAASDGSLADPRLAAAPISSLVAIGPALAARLKLDAPVELAELPAFPGDRLDEKRGGGDLLLQVSAEQPWTTGVLTEHLLASAKPTGATLRWSQAGLLPPVPDGETPRNLFGFKDGSANPDPADPGLWHSDGTILVYRRIRMDSAAFTALPTDRQELAMGRRLASGAPLTGTAEHDDPDIYIKHPDGSYVIPADAHVRLSSPRLDGGARMLRRGYSYDDAPDDRGLLFCAFMRDPALFTRVQNRLAGNDALNPFLTHNASAVAWVLPGSRPGRPLGATL
ncbi:Dyp-type peroxidase [Kitasatospora griseola]|uniref:Dyp-type peroxidase n=1 Tax=Kitasatospora griseola TaxID=2064 RepID=UPI0005C4FD2A|nr:Dyp-type peroxidase [Kitasatospora griseola]